MTVNQRWIRVPLFAILHNPSVSKYGSIHRGALLSYLDITQTNTGYGYTLCAILTNPCANDNATTMRRAREVRSICTLPLQCSIVQYTSLQTINTKRTIPILTSTPLPGGF